MFSECPKGTYGVNCSLICSCANGGRCDLANGTCDCIGKWKGDLCNETIPEVVSLSPEEANLQAEMNLICLIESGINLTHAEISSTDFPNLETTFEKVNDTLYEAHTYVHFLEFKNVSFNCSAENEHGVSVNEFVISVIEPPFLSYIPEVVSKTDTMVEIKWKKWEFDDDGGGKFNDTIKYIVMYKEHNTKDWHYNGKWEEDVYRRKIENLNPETYYEIAVQCKRPGIKGEGHISPILRTYTSCNFTNETSTWPKNFTAKAEPTGIIFSWERPSQKEIGCSVNKYVLKYWLKNDTSSAKQEDINIEKHAIYGLKPDTEYEIELSLVSSNQVVGKPAKITVTTEKAGSFFEGSKIHVI